MENDLSGEMEAMLRIYHAAGVNIMAEITDSHVEITAGAVEWMSFDYRLSGNKLVDTADESIVRYRMENETLTLIFEDCDMIFSRAQ